MKKVLAQEVLGLVRSALGVAADGAGCADGAPRQHGRPSAAASEYVRREELGFLFSPDCDWAADLAISQDELFRRAIYQRVVDSTLLLVLDAAQEQGVPVAVLKGAVLQECYPAGMMRTSADIDLFVPPEYRQRFHALMEGLGANLACDVDALQLGVSDYFFPNNVHFEVHFLICINMSAGQRVIAREEGLFSATSFTQVPFKGRAIPTLEPTLHLGYMLYHIAKHLMFWEQKTVRMLVDISLFVRRYREEIDWQRLERFMERIGHRRIAGAIFTLCAQELGMPAVPWQAAPAADVEQLMKEIPTRLGAWQSFRERHAWTVYKATLLQDDDGRMDSCTVFHPGIYVAFLPVSIAWSLRRKRWGLPTDYKRTRP